MDFPLPGTPANSSLEINNSEFRQGISTIQLEPKSGFAGGLEIIVDGLNGHKIHISINNTVIAENSGFITGNMYISIMYGVEHVSIRFDRCHIHSGNLTSTSAPWSFATGLLCGITFVNEHANGNTMPVHISNTKFTSNYGGAVTFFFW